MYIVYNVIYNVFIYIFIFIYNTLIYNNLGFGGHPLFLLCSVPHRSRSSPGLRAGRSGGGRAAAKAAVSHARLDQGREGRRGPPSFTVLCGGRGWKRAWPAGISCCRLRGQPWQEVPAPAGEPSGRRGRCAPRRPGAPGELLRWVGLPAKCCSQASTPRQTPHAHPHARGAPIPTGADNTHPPPRPDRRRRRARGAVPPKRASGGTLPRSAAGAPAGGALRGPVPRQAGPGPGRRQGCQAPAGLTGLYCRRHAGKPLPRAPRCPPTAPANATASDAGQRPGQTYLTKPCQDPIEVP